MAIIIGICDDNSERVQLLVNYINHNLRGSQYSIVESTSPKDFLSKLEANRPALVFLDIDMGQMSGIQLGDAIKELYGDTVIVYITAHEEYAVEAFRLRAFHYLLKPVTQETFGRVLNEALLRMKLDCERKPDNVFAIQTKGEMIRLLYSEIRYFEKIGHKILVHTASRSFSYYDNFTNLVRGLPVEAFVQCHQGYIVNADKIRSYRDKTLFVDGNIELPVSRSFAENVKKTLARRLFASKEGI